MTLGDHSTFKDIGGLKQDQADALVKCAVNSSVNFIGDSAGGGLLISAIGEMLKQYTVLPQAIVLISPWINLACSNASYEENKKKGPILSKGELKKFAGIYSGDSPVERSNPENSRLSTFPPLLILTGTNEVLIDDSKHFYSKIKKMQSNSILTIYENQNHVWLLSDIHTAASQKALNEICDFLEKN